MNDKFNQLLDLAKKHAPDDRTFQLFARFISNPLIADRLIVAPASSALSKHHAWDGGLLDHILEVTELLLDTATHLGQIPVYFSSWEGLMTCVLHDLHKIGDLTGQPEYIENLIKSRKKDVEFERSSKVPWKTNDAAFDFKHSFSPIPAGGLSTRELMQQSLVYLLSRNGDFPEGDLSLSILYALDPEAYGVMVTDKVEFAVRHHAGMYDLKVRSALAGGKETPLMLTMHYCDMLSSRRARWNSAPTVEAGDE